MEHKVKSYTRRLKNGKTITVRAHTRKGKDGRSQSPSSGDDLILKNIRSLAESDNVGKSNKRAENFLIKAGILTRDRDGEIQFTKGYDLPKGKQKIAQKALDLYEEICG